MDYDLDEFLTEYDDYTRQVVFAKLSLFPSRLSQWFELIDSGEESVGKHVAWIERQFDWERKSHEVMGDNGVLHIPSKKLPRLAVYVNLLRRIENGQISFLPFVHDYFYGGRSAEAAAEKFTSQIFDPFASELRRYIERYFDEELPEEGVAFQQPVPAAGRFVTINHNAPQYAEVMTGLEGIEHQLRASNAISPEDRERSLGELAAIKEVLAPTTVRVDVLMGFVVPTLSFIGLLLIETVAGAAITNTILPSLKLLLPSMFGP
jgi:hypothetical protein